VEIFGVMFLAIYIAGRVNIDTIVEVDDIFLSGRKYVGRVVSECIGGSGANIAIAIARFNKKLNPKLIASIGRDYADYILGMLSSEGVDTSKMSIYSYMSGRAYVFIDKRCEATIVTIPGANEYPPDRDRYIDIGDANALVVANIDRATALNLMNIVRGLDIPIFLDPGKSWFSVDYLNSVENKCFILPNRYEFRDIFGIDVDRYIQDIKAIDGRCIVVVKLGAEGAMAIDKNSWEVIKISSLDIEGLGLKAKTTAGCGDVFTGVFTARYLESRDIVDSIEYASIAAGLKRSKILPSDAPIREEIEDALTFARRRGLMSITIRKL
jgi:ribokinase